MPMSAQTCAYCMTSCAVSGFALSLTSLWKWVRVPCASLSVCVALVMMVSNSSHMVFFLSFVCLFFGELVGVCEPVAFGWLAVPVGDWLELAA